MERKKIDVTSGQISIFDMVGQAGSIGKQNPAEERTTATEKLREKGEAPVQEPRELQQPQELQGSQELQEITGMDLCYRARLKEIAERKRQQKQEQRQGQNGAA